MPEKTDLLKILCFGMGAIGTYIGGSLAAAGHRLTFIEQAEKFQRSQTTSLKIRKKTGDINISGVKITSNLEAAFTEEKYDVALLAIKAFDTPSLISSLLQYKGRLPTILCLQNGVENELKIESMLGEGSVIGASITTAVRRIGLGEVQLEKLRGVAIETGTPLAGQLISAFNQAGLKAMGYADRNGMKWSKMLTNLQVNATSAILNWTPAEVLRNPIVYKIEVMQLKEALAVMKKIGLQITDLPGTPVKLLIMSLANLPLILGRYLVGIPLSKARGGKMPSLQIDLKAGRDRSEVEFLNGAVARFGKKVGVATPVNQVLSETLMGMANGTIDKNMYFGKPDQLMKKIEEAS
jgi:2-dehydropantoate 2-reductase